MSANTPPLKRFQKLFSDQGFRGPVLTLMSGSMAALAAAYLAQPILTRLYTPEAFGIADYFIGVLTVLATGASLRYEDALMSPEEDRDASAVIWLSAVLSIVFVVLTLAAIPFADAIARGVRIPGLAPFIPLIPFTLFLMKLAKLGELWLARKSRFRSITVGDVSNKFSMVGVRLAAGTAPSPGPGGLIGGFLAGHAVAAGAYLWTIGRGRLLPRIPSRMRLWSTAVRFRRFPIYSLPSSTMAAAVARLPILLLPFYFSIETVGFYGRAFIVLAVPLGLLGNAVSQVFFVKAAEARLEGNLDKLTEDVHARLVMIGVFPTLILLLAGPDLFDFVLGDSWRVSGEYIRYLGLWLFLGSVSAPLTRLFDVMERQRADFLTSLLMFIATAAALLMTGPRGDIHHTLIVVGAAGVIVRLVQLGTSTLGTGATVGHLALPYLKYGLFALPGIVLTAAVTTVASPLLSTTSAFAGGLIYLGLVAWDEGYLTRRRDAE